MPSEQAREGATSVPSLSLVDCKCGDERARRGDECATSAPNAL
jgi:hypothetical protein